MLCPMPQHEAPKHQCSTWESINLIIVQHSFDWFLLLALVLHFPDCTALLQAFLQPWALPLRALYRVGRPVLQIALGSKTEDICVEWATGPPTMLKCQPSDLTLAETSLEPLTPERAYSPMPARVDLFRGYSSLFSHNLTTPDSRARWVGFPLPTGRIASLLSTALAAFLVHHALIPLSR